MFPTCLAQSVGWGVPTAGNVIAVNPVTNKIYTGNETLPYVTVIDGATNEPTKIAIGGTSGPIVVNPVTNNGYRRYNGQTDEHTAAHSAQDAALLRWLWYDGLAETTQVADLLKDSGRVDL